MAAYAGVDPKELRQTLPLACLMPAIYRFRNGTPKNVMSKKDYEALMRKPLNTEEYQDWDPKFSIENQATPEVTAQ